MRRWFQVITKRTGVTKAPVSFQARLPQPAHLDPDQSGQLGGRHSTLAGGESPANAKLSVAKPIWFSYPRWEESLLIKIILMIGAILMFWSSNATAQEGIAIGHCVADLRSLCPGVPPGYNNLRACMREHIRDVSYPCLVTLAKFAEVRRSLKECSAHLHQQCASVERAGGQFAVCLKSAVASLSDTCKDALAGAVRRARD
jgi:hypothetical protein